MDLAQCLTWAFLINHFVIVSLSGFLLAKRQNYFPLKTRSFSLMWAEFFSFSFFGTIIVASGFGLVNKSLNTPLRYFVYSFLVLHSNLLYLFRIINVWIQHRRQEEKYVPDYKLEFVLKHVHTIFVVAFLIVYFYPVYRILRFCQTNPYVPMRDLKYYYICSVTATLSILQMVFCYLISRKNDIYYLKIEFYFVAGIGFVHTILFVAAFEKKLFQWALLTIILGMHFYLIVSFIVIGLLTFFKQKTVYSVSIETAFRKMFESKKILNAFRKHLTKEFAAENLDFLMKVEKFKRAFPGEKAFNIAEKLCSVYLENGAIFELILPAEIKKEIFQVVKERKFLCLTTFDEAKESVLKMLKHDNFLRFFDCADKRIFK